MATEIDWANLSFGYRKTNYNVRCTYRDGKWGEIEVTDSEYINIHIAATALHYGQEIFEGLKAFRGKDGKIRVFRLEENARRIRQSAEGILMEPVPEELFRQMVVKAVELNADFVPPYGSGASLYIRPLEIGVSARVGVKPSDEYVFLILVTPVGPYFKEGFKPTNICIMRDYDRVAPKVTGRWKVGGNYAASL
ncbi:MAG: aminotransferase class IV, partial [Muribaculaceae bacterium]|nr:aminotransferase class IV [Muribaculaceae bacterium]